jgi:hypothetical protein
LFTDCADHGKNPPIENSHMLPMRWTIRFILEGSVPRKLRRTDNINRRVQDVEKLPLLCSNCAGSHRRLGLAQTPYPPVTLVPKASPILARTFYRHRSCDGTAASEDAPRYAVGGKLRSAPATPPRLRGPAA